MVLLSLFVCLAPSDLHVAHRIFRCDSGPLSSCGAWAPVAPAHRLSYPTVWDLSPPIRNRTPHALHWKVGCKPLDHQGSLQTIWLILNRSRCLETWVYTWQNMHDKPQWSLDSGSLKASVQGIYLHVLSSFAGGLKCDSTGRRLLEACPDCL